MADIAKKLADLEAKIAEETENCDGYFPPYLYDMIAEAYMLSLKLRK